jgi:hypothetical protein
MGQRVERLRRLIKAGPRAGWSLGWSRPTVLRRWAVAASSLRLWRCAVSHAASSASAFVPSFSSVVWSAFRASSCGFVSWRVSLHSSSGRVAVASFSDSARACAFARAQARLLGRSVVVRPCHLGAPCQPSWRVSVPVSVWAPSPSFGQLLLVGGGGLRGVASALRVLGFVTSVA